MNTDDLSPSKRRRVDDADDDWSYHSADLILAPMVRMNRLPFRLLAAEYG
jgi:hypothetical protein